MKLSLLKLTIAAVAFSGAAAVTAGDFEVGVGVPYYSFDSNMGVEDKGGVSLNAGYRFDKPFGIELTGAQVETEFDDGTEIDITDFRLDGLWYLHNEAPVLPYAALGYGIMDAEVGSFSDDEDTVSLGLGVKAHLASRLRARLEGRWLHGLDSYNNHSIVTLGLGYVFGGTKAAPKPIEPVFVDADKDGVEDSVDQCTSTPAGVSVDAKGCAIDTDKDGVADYLDKCPETDRKLKVDAEGCPVVLTEDVSIDLDVKFASGSDVVPTEYFAEVRGVARFMEQYQNSQVIIEGHTDTSGSAAFNKKLSQKRANAVASLLSEQYGIEASRVRAIGYGEEQPLVEENTKADQAKNRRVVAKVSAKKEVMEAK